MTSVGVVWSAVARMKCLKEVLKAAERLPNEGEELLKGLEIMAESLKEGYDPKSRDPELEKKIVRVSYEIVDAVVDGVVDGSKASKWKKSSGNANKLQELQSELNGYQKDDLEPNSSGEEKASPVQRHKNSLFNINRLKMVGTSRFVKLAVAENRNDVQGISIGGCNNSELQQGQSSDNKERCNPEAGHEQSSNNKAANLDELIESLSDSSSEHSVVYIVGESGIGKTSFTRKLFEDPKLQSCFKLSAWVPINNNFQIKKVLQLLLQKLTMGPSQDLHINPMNEIQLIAHIFAVLDNNKDNLLVLDDIRTVDDWESIRLALPISNSTRVIVTSSSTDFLRLPNSYQISGLTQHEITNLLHKQSTFRTESQDVEKAIFDISGGSPLLAKIFGKSFLSKVSTENEQQLVDELNSYLGHRGKPQVLEACYNRLAPELKPCLLYMGQFPQGQDIEVEKLYQLLRAENLIILPTESEISLQSLTDNLKELAETSFIEMGKDNKSCRLHDRVQEFCKSKGSDEEFFESSTTVGTHTRRLAVHLSKCIKFQSPDTSKKILSLLIFDTLESADKEKQTWPAEINDLKEFSRVRVINFDGVDFTARKLPKGIDRLVMLRYLSFRGCKLDELPSSMANLTQLETLDLVVDKGCQKMLIPSNIFAKMTRMVNLYLPRLYAASNGKTKVQLQGLDRLEILVNFDTEACDVTVLSQFNKLKILSTISRGKTDDLEKVINFINRPGKELQHSSVDIRGFDCYSKGSTSALEKLLECQFVHSILIEGRIGELPKNEGHAEKVEEIILDGSEIENDPMDYLGKFQKLQSLDLGNDAFLGSEIVISAAADAFPNLRSMKLHNLQYLEKLTIQEGTMPQLSSLQIHTCACLKELSIPEQLDQRLRKAQRENGGDFYSITPLPTTFNTTP